MLVPIEAQCSYLKKCSQPANVQNYSQHFERMDQIVGTPRPRRAALTNLTIGVCTQLIFNEHCSHWFSSISDF